MKFYENFLKTAKIKRSFLIKFLIFLILTILLLKFHSTFITLTFKQLFISLRNHKPKFLIKSSPSSLHKSTKKKKILCI